MLKKPKKKKKEKKRKKKSQLSFHQLNISDQTWNEALIFDKQKIV